MYIFASNCRNSTTTSLDLFTFQIGDGHAWRFLGLLNDDCDVIVQIKKYKERKKERKYKKIFKSVIHVLPLELLAVMSNVHYSF